MVKMEMDCNLKKLGQRFQVVSLCLRKIAKNQSWGELNKTFTSIIYKSSSVLFQRLKTIATFVNYTICKSFIELTYGLLFL